MKKYGKIDNDLQESEKSTIQLKKELIQVRDKLLKNQELRKVQKEEFQKAKETLNSKVKETDNIPVSNFETADKDEADKLIKEAYAIGGDGTYGITNIDELQGFNSTSIIANAFQRQTKYERKASEYAKSVLEQIDNGTLSMKDFGNQVQKFKETMDLLKYVAYSYDAEVLQSNYMFGKDNKYNHKYIEELESKKIPEDYKAIDELLQSVDEHFEGKISDEKYNQDLDKFGDYREQVIKDVPQPNFVSKLLHGNTADGKYFYEQRFHAFDWIWGELPISRLPVVQKQKDNFRQALMIKEEELNRKQEIPKVYDKQKAEENER